MMSATGDAAGQAERDRRAARDARLSTGLLQGGGASFIDSWYRGPLWQHLRAHPAFERIIQNRKDTGALGHCSVGCEICAWRQAKLAASAARHVLEGCITSGDRMPLTLTALLQGWLQVTGLRCRRC